MGSSATDETVLAVNENAVRLMRSGKFTQAIQYLEAALRRVHVSVVGLVTVDLQSRKNEGIQIKMIEVPDYGSVSSAFSFFNKAMIVGRNSSSRSDGCCGLTGNLMAMVLLFNTALALHSLGQEVFLRKAVKCYRMAMALSAGTVDSNSVVERLVYVASVNNLGYIHYCFSEKEEATNCLTVLRIVLSQWEQRDEFFSRNLTVDDTLHFNLTVLYYGCLNFVLPTAVAA